MVTAHSARLPRRRPGHSACSRNRDRRRCRPGRTSPWASPAGIDPPGPAPGLSGRRGRGRLLSERPRRMDVPCRLGGKEFAILLSGTSREGGLCLAEASRRELATLSFATPRHENVRVAITGGVAVPFAGDASGEEAIQRADASL
ncbi:diguanylate cyclase [Halomonas maura]|nr:diguanylate cyclase [Halomonas maura]MDN3557398.1 diguanylate cyclase [Halomonas maura]